LGEDGHAGAGQGLLLAVDVGEEEQLAGEGIADEARDVGFHADALDLAFQNAAAGAGFGSCGAEIQDLQRSKPSPLVDLTKPPISRLISSLPNVRK
jgi:hypothetical protein